MAISREKIHDLVEVFYQPTFKTFYINSTDGKTFVKPVGVFVSLGITTSIKVLDDIKNVINSTGEYKAILAEISSKKVAGQFLNTLINTENPQQYKLMEFSDDILNEKEAKKELDEMKSLMNPEQSLEILKEYAPKISRLQDLINKLTTTDGWNAHLIQKSNDGEYRIFHQYVNYRRDDELEYRLGIYVCECDCEEPSN